MRVRVYLNGLSAAVFMLLAAPTAANAQQPKADAPFNAPDEATHLRAARSGMRFGSGSCWPPRPARVCPTMWVTRCGVRVATWTRDAHNMPRPGSGSGACSPSTAAAMRW